MTGRNLMESLAFLLTGRTLEWTGHLRLERKEWNSLPCKLPLEGNHPYQKIKKLFPGTKSKR